MIRYEILHDWRLSHLKHITFAHESNYIVKGCTHSLTDESHIVNALFASSIPLVKMQIADIQGHLMMMKDIGQAAI